MTNTERIVYQPLHPSMRKKLDPEYIRFHDEVLQYIEPADKKPWDPASRFQASPMANTQQKNVDVGSVEDREISTFQVRIFTPAGDAPASGWPCLLWFHGGGWVMGGLGSENGFLRHVCKCTWITLGSLDTERTDLLLQMSDVLSCRSTIVMRLSMYIPLQSMIHLNLCVGWERMILWPV
jgi:hypothetical protein